MSEVPVGDKLSKRARKSSAPAGGPPCKPSRTRAGDERTERPQRAPGVPPAVPPMHVRGDSIFDVAPVKVIAIVLDAEPTIRILVSVSYNPGPVLASHTERDAPPSLSPFRSFEPLSGAHCALARAIVAGEETQRLQDAGWKRPRSGAVPPDTLPTRAGQWTPGKSAPGRYRDLGGRARQVARMMDNLADCIEAASTAPDARTSYEATILRVLQACMGMTDESQACLFFDDMYKARRRLFRMENDLAREHGTPAPDPTEFARMLLGDFAARYQEYAARAPREKVIELFAKKGSKWVRYVSIFRAMKLGTPEDPEVLRISLARARRG